jgi:hypothetical protein
VVQPTRETVVLVVAVPVVFQEEAGSSFLRSLAK